jgi:hypothetical protein
VTSGQAARLPALRSTAEANVAGLLNLDTALYVDQVVSLTAAQPTQC